MHARTAAIAIAMAVILGAAVGTASAGRLSLSETRWTATFARWEFSGGFATSKCNLTLASSFHTRTMPKVLESLMGYVTAASIGGCEALSATVLTATLPWHIRYHGFTGTLPNMTAIETKVIGFAFSIREAVGFSCLSVSTAASPNTLTFLREAGGRISSIGIGGSTPCSPTIGTMRAASNSITPSLSVTLI